MRRDGLCPLIATAAVQSIVAVMKVIETHSPDEGTQQIMHELQHPALSSSTPSPPTRTWPPVFRLFFFGTSSDGGA